MPSALVPPRRTRFGAGVLTAVTTLALLTVAPATADDGILAVDDTALTGSGVEARIDITANDRLPAAVASIELGTVTGGDATTVTVGDDLSTITFVNHNPRFPNASQASRFATADFTIPYTVTDVDGNTSSATVTVTVAGQPVSPNVRSWLLEDAGRGTLDVTTLRQLNLEAYENSGSLASMIPGAGVTVTGLVSAEHTRGEPIPGGLRLTADPAGYRGNDIVVLELTDAWGRTVQHTAAVTWSNRASLSLTRVKAAVGETVVIDMQRMADEAGLTAIAGSSFADEHTILGGTATFENGGRVAHFTPDDGLVGTATWNAGPLFTWSYKLVNPLQNPNSAGVVHTQVAMFTYVDVQAPPQAADVSVRVGATQSVDLDLRTPAALPWAASTLDLRDAPAHGTATVTGDGVVTYRPASGYPAAGVASATDTFTFAWIDDLGQESVATATVEIVNGPVVVDHVVRTPAGTAAEVDLLAGASGEGVRLESAGPATFGSVEQTGAGAVYTPRDDFVGDDSFRYVGVDAWGQRAEGVVTVRVVAAPTLDDQHHRTPRNVAVTLDPVPVPAATPTAGYLPDLVLDELGTPRHGTVTPADGSAITYLPRADFVGTDSFTVTARDAWGRTVQGLVTIEVYDETVVELDPTPREPAAPRHPGGPPATGAGADGGGGSPHGDDGLALTGAQVAPGLALAGALLALGTLIVAMRRRHRA